MQRILKLPARRLLLRAFALLAVFAVALNVWMVRRARGRTFADPAAAPEAPAALVLGTSKTLANGRVNVHWRGRMDAAAALWKAGKVKHFLVSGDNRRHDYNEPRDMRDGLIERGVPPERITMDFAGLRTLDSVIRAREIFGLERVVIVSDDFHLPRALWLADRRGLEAAGFHGPPLPWSLSGKSRAREWLARLKAAGEEWILRRGARHYGERIPLPVTDGGDSSANP